MSETDLIDLCNGKIARAAYYAGATNLLEHYLVSFMTDVYYYYTKPSTQLKYRSIWIIREKKADSNLRCIGLMSTQNPSFEECTNFIKGLVAHVSDIWTTGNLYIMKHDETFVEK